MEISKEHISDWLKQLQATICDALEKADCKGKFSSEMQLPLVMTFSESA